MNIGDVEKCGVWRSKHLGRAFDTPAFMIIRYQDPRCSHQPHLDILTLVRNKSKPIQMLTFENSPFRQKSDSASERSFNV